MEPAELVGAGVGELAGAGVGEPALVVEVVVNEVDVLALVVLVVNGVAAHERPRSAVLEGDGRDRRRCSSPAWCYWSQP